MKLEIKKITLHSFRGCKSGEYVFDGNSKIKGANGSGKSTLMTSVLWCLIDVDSKLVKNPDVVPIGEEECSPTVEVEFELDGKSLIVCKEQRYKKKFTDGKTTASIVNNYSINGIEKSYHNFVEDLKERGIDMDKLIYLTHPEAFTADVSAKGREKIRAILFSMIDNLSDAEIAKELDVPELSDLLENKGYKIDEADSLVKSSIRKLNERYGKANEIIDGRIAGIMQSKSKQDITVLQEQKKQYESEIARCEKALEDIAGNRSGIMTELSNFRTQKDKLTNDANKELQDSKIELDKKIRELTAIIDEQSFKLSQTEAEIARKESLLSEAHQDIENQRIKYKIEQDSILDESDLSCPTCFRPYEKDKIKEIKAAFEAKKAEKLKVIKSTGEDLKAKIKALDEEIDALFTDKENYTKLVEETKKLRDDAQARADSLPLAVDMNAIEEYVKVVKDIENLESQLSVSDEERKNELQTSKDVATQMLHQIVAEIGICEHDKELDKQIEALRIEKREAEIQKAQNEKIADQIKTFIQAKNNLLTSKINEKFSLVDWHLYEYQKNGDIKPVCEPYIDGKPMTSAANGSLVTLAKISICADLQRFFEQYVPIWVEDYSLFSSETEKRINTESQLIGLVVTESKELTVEYEG